MPTQHAILSASSANRWIHCPPSVRLSELFENETSEFAKQGTDCHTLCEYKLAKALKRKAKNPTKTLEYYDEEMEECANAYVTFVMEEVAKAKETCKDPVVVIEQRLNFSRFVPDGFGTGDCLIISDETLRIIDYKHGLGVLVNAENNPQMMCYALGALELYDGIYDIQQVQMTIFQPRRESISTAILSKEELLQWAEEILMPAAQLAFHGKGEFQVGSWCKFCPAKHQCRARAEFNLELAKKEFQQANLLSDEEVEEILVKVDDLVSWAKDIKEYALKSALSGKKWNSFKLVEGRSIRRFKDEDIVAEVLQAQGYPSVYKQSVLSVAEMEKYIGKKSFNEIVGDLVFKPKGKLTLVSNTDKRKEVEITNAKDEFKNLTEE